MTQTIQEALLKAGLISKEKLAKAEAEKKAAQRAQHARQNYQGSQRPQHQQGSHGGSQGYQGNQRPQGPQGPQGQQRPPQQQTRPDVRPQNAAAPRPATAAAAAPSAPKPAARPPQKPSRPYSPPAPPAHKIGDGLSEGKHAHHIRTDCDACGRSSPDVEYYEHKNRSLDKYWLCVKCADTNNILDDFRQTSQSSQSQRGLFQRGYGHTKRR